MQTLERCSLVYISSVCSVWELKLTREKKIGFASIALFFSALWLWCGVRLKSLMRCVNWSAACGFCYPSLHSSQFAYLGECEPAVDAALLERPNFITAGKRWLCISRFLASGHFLLTANYLSLCKMRPTTQMLIEYNFSLNSTLLSIKNYWK